MNIFVTDVDPYLAANNLCDSHVVRMLSVSCQLLANCVPEAELFLHSPSTEEGRPRKHHHDNHILVRWLKESEEHQAWLIHHAHAILTEYHKRFGKENKFNKVHPFLTWYDKRLANHSWSYHTKFCVSIPSFAICRRHPAFNESNPILCYQLFIVIDKIFATWERHVQPPFVVEYMQHDLIKKLRRETMKTIYSRTPAY